ncbi:MAG: nucleotidyl transferase AbiEii/AbiGii toxin family protein [Verrucomicrobiota bacterium]
MIEPHCHSREWIESQREGLNAVDPEILERAIFALTLLCALSHSSLGFVFKGGTSLLLHLPKPQRLSIDIDIVCDTDAGLLAPILDSLLTDTPFSRWEEQLRGEHRLPKRLHYKFYYDSPLRPGRETPILLDIVTEKNTLSDLVEKSITTPFIETSKPVFVTTPTVNALLGDKLTAFAPNTIGVPLTERFSQQVIKQLFDIAQLYDVVTDLESVAAANRTAHSAECSYRDSAPSYADYLADTIETCFQLCSLDLKGFTETEHTRLLRRGIKQLPNHLIDCRFRLPQAKIAAAKTAALVSIIGRDSISENLPVFDVSHIDQIKDHQLPENFTILQRLKGISPEAYYYWTTLAE